MAITPGNPGPGGLGSGSVGSGGSGGGGSKKDAAKFIENKTPKNASGSVKKALKLSQNIKKNTKKKNPKMQDAVGPSELASMLAEVAAAFSGGGQSQQKDSLCEQLQDTLNGLLANVAFLQGITPTTPDIQLSIQETLEAIAQITTQMQNKGCPITAPPPPTSVL